MILYKVLINYEVTGHILVAAETREEAETKARTSIVTAGWKEKAVREPEEVEGTATVLEGWAEPVGEVVT